MGDGVELGYDLPPQDWDMLADQQVGAPRRSHASRTYYDDGSVVGENPDYPNEAAASISPLARGAEASPSKCRTSTHVRVRTTCL